MFVRYQYGSYPVTEQRFRPTHYTNTHTGDVLNDPARDLSETRREYQCEPNGKSHCVQQVLQQVNEEVRPQLRDGRNKERPSWSLGRCPWHTDHVKPSKSPTTAALTTGIVGRCTADHHSIHPCESRPTRAAAGSERRPILSSIALARLRRST